MGSSSPGSTLTAEELRNKILDLVGEYAVLAHQPSVFEPGISTVPVSGRVYGAEDIRSLVDASLDFWLTTGRFNTEFEKQLANFLGVRHVLTTNSGSSANLLAVSALTSHLLEERRLQPGDEVITAAVSFPTTVNPLLLYGLTPVFVDSELGTYNPSAASIQNAITKKTKAIVLAHTLGNPLELAPIMDLAAKHHLWLIEDCCDALGSTYAGKKVGTFGHIGTLSFYPAHHITMGEGGAVFTQDGRLKRILESFRDWGRDCYCAPGKDNTCGKRFAWQLGKLPKGYDHKYIYSHAGFNLKITDMQAAVGLAQMNHLDDFIAARKKNFEFLKNRLKPFEYVLLLPEVTPQSDPAWFGFPITVKQNDFFNRAELTAYLNKRKIATRFLFAGNITQQPYFAGRKYRVSGDINNANTIMNDTFWIGVFPGLTEAMLEYAVSVFEEFIGAPHED